MFNVYWYALIGAVLFFILSPGVLITVPPKKDCGMFVKAINNGGCATSIAAAAVHAALFGLILGGIVFYTYTKY